MNPGQSSRAVSEVDSVEMEHMQWVDQADIRAELLPAGEREALLCVHAVGRQLEGQLMNEAFQIHDKDARLAKLYNLRNVQKIIQSTRLKLKKIDQQMEVDLLNKQLLQREEELRGLRRQLQQLEARESQGGARLGRASEYYQQLVWRHKEWQQKRVKAELIKKRKSILQPMLKTLNQFLECEDKFKLKYEEEKSKFNKEVKDLEKRVGALEVLVKESRGGRVVELNGRMEKLREELQRLEVAIARKAREHLRKRADQFCLQESNSQTLLAVKESEEEETEIERVEKVEWSEQTVVEKEGQWWGPAAFICGVLLFLAAGVLSE